jgi:hypothetical protein
MLAFVTSHLKTFLGVPSRLDAAYSPGRPTYPLGSVLSMSGTRTASWQMA